MNAGKVWLVGAGPGDPGLLTLKAARVLERAEVVVHDALVGQAVLAMVPEGAEIIDVGKRAGQHPVPQARIEQILIERGQAGLRVVRLKGGDPFLFGRGGEELMALQEAGLDVEVVPGISSALAVPAYAGIPVTHRDYASSLHIVTAHGRRDPAPGPPAGEAGKAGQTLEDGLDYRTLAMLSGTLVILMGAASLPEICAGLVAAGKPADTPAALIERGTTARQRSVRGNLSTLPGLVAAAGAGAPALIVVGAVAALGAQLDWRARLPLAGKRVVITRPAQRNGALADLLRDSGAEVIELPCIRTRALPGPLPALAGYDWMAFTSPAGVAHFFEKLEAENRDIREIGSARIAAIGPATAQALRGKGLRVELIPERHETEALGEVLSGRVLAVQALQTAGTLPGERLAVYETVSLPPALVPEDVDYLAFASASAVEAFRAACPQMRAVAACIGPTTAQAARAAGYTVRMAKEATIPSLVACMKEDSTC